LLCLAPQLVLFSASFQRRVQTSAASPAINVDCERTQTTNSVNKTARETPCETAGRGRKKNLAGEGVGGAGTLNHFSQPRFIDMSVCVYQSALFVVFLTEVSGQRHTQFSEQKAVTVSKHSSSRPSNVINPSQTVFGLHKRVTISCKGQTPTNTALGVPVIVKLFVTTSLRSRPITSE